MNAVNEESVQLVDGVIHFRRYSNVDDTSLRSLNKNKSGTYDGDSPTSTSSSIISGVLCSRRDNRLAKLFEDNNDMVSPDVTSNKQETRDITYDYCSYNIFVQLRKFPAQFSKQPCDFVKITLEQRCGVNDEETKSVNCLFNNIWKTKVNQLDGLRISFKNASWPNELLARFNLTGLKLDKSHKLTNSSGISVSVIIESVAEDEMVDEGDVNSHLLTGEVNIKLIGGENFPYLNDDPIGPISVVFEYEGQRIFSFNDTGTSNPRWMDVMKFKMLCMSERNISILVVRTDKSSGTLEEVSSYQVDFSGKTEGDIHFYRLKMTRTDENPVFVKFYLSYSFKRQLPWLDASQQEIVSPHRIGKFRKPPDFGKIKLDIYHWTPLSSGIQNSLLYLVVRCGSNYAVTQSTIRANQKPIHSIVFPLTDLDNKIEIRAYEDGLYECKEIGVLLLSLSTLPVPVTVKMRTTDLWSKGICEIRYQTSLKLDAVKYVLRCFESTNRIVFWTNQNSMQSAEKWMTELRSLVNLKEKVVHIVSWKDKLFSLLACAFLLLVFNVLQIYHIPLIMVVILLKELNMVKIFTRRLISFRRTPIVVKSLLTRRRGKGRKPLHQETPHLCCSCSDNMLCHQPKTNNSEFHVRPANYDFVYLYHCWNGLLNFVFMTFSWVAPIYSLTFLIFSICLIFLFYLVPSKDMITLIFIHLFTKKFYHFDLFLLLFNFVMNAPSRDDLTTIGSV